MSLSLPEAKIQDKYVVSKGNISTCVLAELKKLGGAQILGQGDASSMIRSHQLVSLQVPVSWLSPIWTLDQGNKPALPAACHVWWHKLMSSAVHAGHVLGCDGPEGRDSSAPRHAQRTCHHLLQGEDNSSLQAE